MNAREQIKHLKKEIARLKRELEDGRVVAFKEWCQNHFGAIPEVGDQMLLHLTWTNHETRKRQKRVYRAEVVSLEDFHPDYIAPAMEEIEPGYAKLGNEVGRYLCIHIIDGVTHKEVCDDDYTPPQEWTWHLQGYRLVNRKELRRFELV